MVGVRQRTVVTNKPGRSDEVLDADQQLRIADRVKTHFESVAPKRPPKPSRSESDSTRDLSSFAGGGSDDMTIPEFHKFQSLRSQSQDVISGKGGGDLWEEFVETEYYKKLDSIDKNHHTTGSGFIKVGNEANGYDLRLKGGSDDDESGRGIADSCFRSNPATNDWIPCAEEQILHVSSKPNRSES